jgi:hypothetical protein
LPGKNYIERRLDMRRIFVVLAILVFGYSGSHAGLFKDAVDLADLSQLSAEALETFKDNEFNVFLMKVKHNGAKVLENKAKNDLKTSKLTLDAKKSTLNLQKPISKRLRQPKIRRVLMLWRRLCATPIKSLSMPNY